jgi:hypothetical protein
MYLALALRMDERCFMARKRERRLPRRRVLDNETHGINYFLMVQAATIIEISIVCSVPKQPRVGNEYSVWNTEILPMVKRLAFPWRWNQRRCVGLWMVDQSVMMGIDSFLNLCYFPASTQNMYSKCIFLGFRTKRFPYSESTYWARSVGLYVPSFNYYHHFIKYQLTDSHHT